jgi:hypothetical protein
VGKMKNLLLILTIFLLLCIGCTRHKNTQALAFEQEQVLDMNLLAIVLPEQSSVVEVTLEERRRQFEGMTILDMIDLYIHNEQMLYVSRNNTQIGFFQFLSRESIQWYYGSSGYKFFPYIYIIDENNLRIELFAFLGRAEEVRMGIYCSAQKYYIEINTKQLIDYYLRIKRPLETSVVMHFFFVNITEDQEKERNGYFFKVLRDATVHEDKAKQGTLLGILHAGNMVKVIDIYYQNLSDRYPVAVKIETENFNGWVNVDSVDFIHFGDY